MTTPPMTSLLEVIGLRVWFTQYARGLRRREVVGVEDMDLRVGAGELVSMVGASGAGKSLLAHAVLGLLPANAGQSGKVCWHGREVSPAERVALAGRGIAMLPQTLSALDPTATVRRQVRSAARTVRRPAGDGIEAIRTAGLDETVDGRFPHELSGGMARRVLTAMALLGDPELVIADEPTPGLGPDAVTEVLQRLRRMADDGRGVLLITHDIEAALEVSDRVVVVRAGRTVDEAQVAAFSGDGAGLAHPYSRALWQALPGNGFRSQPC